METEVLNWLNTKKEYSRGIAGEMTEEQVRSYVYEQTKAVSEMFTEAARIMQQINDLQETYNALMSQIIATNQLMYDLVEANELNKKKPKADMAVQ